jgi:hypothetical protein
LKRNNKTPGNGKLISIARRFGLSIETLTDHNYQKEMKMAKKTLAAQYGLNPGEYWDQFITPTRWQAWRGTQAWIEVLLGQVCWHWEPPTKELHHVGYAFVYINNRPTTIRVFQIDTDRSVREIEAALANSRFGVYAIEVSK